MSFPRAALPALLLLLAASRAAHALPPPDPGSTWTLQGENDVVSTTPGGSDKYYTNGLRIGWTSGTDLVPDFAGKLARVVWGDGITRIGFDVSQQIYTPLDTAVAHPPLTDRPAAAYLAGTFSILQDKDDSRSTLAASLGVIGPAALGRLVQNGFHELIGDAIDKSWASQLPNEPALELLGERTWRMNADLGPFQVGALPSLTAGIGTVRDYVQAGAILRFGQGLDQDFGAARIRPGLSGDDVFTRAPGVAWYVFVGADGQVVGRDAFLDGDLFSHSRHVQHNTLLGEMEAGGAVIWHGVRLTYTQTWQTQSFKGQKQGLFNFGSLAASFRF